MRGARSLTGPAGFYQFDLDGSAIDKLDEEAVSLSYQELLQIFSGFKLDDDIVIFGLEEKKIGIYGLLQDQLPEAAYSLLDGKSDVFRDIKPRPPGKAAFYLPGGYAGGCRVPE